jgi:hypothetical protein
MKIMKILKIREYLLIAIISSLAIGLFYPYLQVVLNGGFYNYFFWFEAILNESILNFILYLAFSALFGVVVSLSVYNWKNKTCSIKGSVGSGGFGSLLALFTSQCSACLSLASLILPISAVGALTIYNTVFNFISVGLLVIAVHLLGGFK